MTKTDAAAKTLHVINPDVQVTPYCYNITTMENYARFKNTLQTEGLPSKDAPDTPRPVDLLLCCVDNHTARLTINRVCLELGLVWFESGVSETAISGHIQYVQPGVSPCFECLPPLAVAMEIDERKIRREGVCAASLSTTMGIVAGLLVQNALKHLLHFGRVVSYLGYNALNDHFPAETLQPNEHCTNALCKRRQEEYKAFLRKKQETEAKEAQNSSTSSTAQSSATEKKSNPFGIEIVDETPEEDPALTSTANPELRFEFALSLNSYDDSTQNTSDSSTEAQQKTEDSIADLQAELAKLSMS